MDNQHRRIWKVKDNPASDWRVLPGEFTAAEIWEKRQRAEFWIAIPADDDPDKPSS